MKPTILIPDMEATTEIDILEEMLKQDVSFKQARMADLQKDPAPKELVDAGSIANWKAEQKTNHEKAALEWEEAANDLREYLEDPNPQARITVGFIEPRVMTGLDFQWVEAAKGRETLGQYSAELGSAFMEVCREHIRHGVKGHTITEDFEMEAALRIYEINNWVYVLSGLIKDYNSLPQEKKTESSPKPGTNPESTTVSDAGINPTFSEQEDAQSPAQ